MKFCICAEFLDTKLSQKSNFETPEGKHEFQARYVILVIMADYIPRSGNLFISCNARIFEENKKIKIWLIFLKIYVFLLIQKSVKQGY